MIIYNWRAEFSQKELEQIKGCQEISYSERYSYISSVENLVKEMTNALTRYETILNEMENELDNDN